MIARTCVDCAFNCVQERVSAAGELENAYNLLSLFLSLPLGLKMGGSIYAPRYLSQGWMKSRTPFFSSPSATAAVYKEEREKENRA